MKKSKTKEDVAPIIKYNGGNPVCLCTKCKKIITMGSLYCETCKPK